MKIKRKILLSVISICFAFNVAAEPNHAFSGLDERLNAFLVFAIKDKTALDAERKVYADRKVSFEQFIFSIYSGGVKLDNTPDNAKALAQLGGYLEKNRPSLAPELLKKMETFNGVKSNQTFMRQMFLETVRGIIGQK